MIELFIKLLLAHIIGDFVLQPNGWVRDKNDRKIKSKFLYFHVLIHFLLAFGVLKFKIDFLPLVVIVTILHYLIDVSKLYLTGKFNSRLLFFGDQLLHIISLILISCFFSNEEIELIHYLNNKNLVLVLCLILLVQVSSVIMKTIMSKWEISEKYKTESLENAGKYIGILERLFVFGFVINGKWEVVGFLIAAKSVFRFSDLSKAKDRKLTEYILIGTLLSFGLAILVGLFYLSLNNIGFFIGALYYKF